MGNTGALYAALALVGADSATGPPPLSQAPHPSSPASASEAPAPSEGLPSPASGGPRVSRDHITKVLDTQVRGQMRQGSRAPSGACTPGSSSDGLTSMQPAPPSPSNSCAEWGHAPGTLIRKAEAWFQFHVKQCKSHTDAPEPNPQPAGERGLNPAPHPTPSPHPPHGSLCSCETSHPEKSRVTPGAPGCPSRE